MRLDGRRALVTGAGSHGIGRAIAVAFAREGADVVAHHFGNPAAAEDLRREIAACGRRAAVLEADLVDPAQARALVGAAVRLLGGIDVLVANAGTNIRKPFLDLTDADWDQVHAVNLRAYFATAQEAVRHMVAAGAPGRVIMVSSVNERQVDPHMAAYCASKGGVRQLARAMALELAPLGITVNVLAPGPVLTDLTRRHWTEGPAGDRRLAAVAARVPMGRVGRPEDFAGAAIFLASAESAFVTGTSLTVDGGRSLP